MSLSSELHKQALYQSQADAGRIADNITEDAKRLMAAALSNLDSFPEMPEWKKNRIRESFKTVSNGLEELASGSRWIYREMIREIEETDKEKKNAT